MSAIRRDCWMVSMLEVAAALCAGLGVTAATLSIAAPAPSPHDDSVAPSWIVRVVRQRWARENAIAAAAGWQGFGASGLVAVEVSVAVVGGCAAALITGLPVLALAGATSAVAVVRGAIAARARSQQVLRQDAVLEAVRMLRQLLETGANGVNTAIAVLGERGPAPLRSEFRIIAATSVGRRQAWSAARQRVGEPLFDLLAAAVLIQSPSGGELAPLFADLEASVSGAQEVEREARALQMQARSAAAIIVSLPIVFLVVLSALRSPYLDAYHTLAGQAFLLAMLGVMAGSYVWMRRLLLLPGLQGVRLSDA
jgi:Flp pilus assembly protein TadB